ncbi:MAG: oligosaccharide flippase family protein [Alphaproteobacteria bacterium]|nr:oligosaccharide flippase family protein [Alphaproteobacteria bacterium]
MRKSLVASVIGRYAILVLQIATSVVLARLLTPAEMGVWSVGQSAIFLSSTLRDFGAGDYLIRSDDAGRRAIGRVFALMLSISLVCALLLWASRNLLAHFFREPKLADLIDLMTLTYLLMPFGLGALITLEREFAFVQLQLMQAAATIIGSVTAIVLAYRGFSYFSLAWGQLAQMLVLLALRTMARPAAVFCKPIFTGWKGIFRFGVFTTLTAIFTQVSAQSVTALIGRILGLSSLGLYERANGMNNYLSNDLTFSIMQVVYVGFSKVKDKPAELKRLYLATVENLTGVLWPAYALIALLSHQIVLVLYGPKWTFAAPLLAIISLSSLLQAFYVPQVRVLTSFANVRSICAVEFTAMVFRILAVLFLARFGLIWAVVGAVSPSAIVAMLYWRVTSPRLAVGMIDMLAPLGRSFLVLLFTLVGPLLLLLFTPVAQVSATLQLVICLPVAGLGWLLSVRAVSHGLRPEISLAMSHAPRLFRQLLGQANGTAPSRFFR